MAVRGNVCTRLRALVPQWDPVPPCLFQASCSEEASKQVRLPLNVECCFKKPAYDFRPDLARGDEGTKVIHTLARILHLDLDEHMFAFLAI